MGGVALIWTIDCFVGFYLTLPCRERECRAAPGRRRTAAGARLVGALEAGLADQDARQRLSHQLRHAPRLRPVDLGAALHPGASAAFSLNLYVEVAQPVVTLVSSFTPTPYDTRTPSAAGRADRAEESASPRCWRTRARRRRSGAAGPTPAGDVFYSPELRRLRRPLLRSGRRSRRRRRRPAELYFDSERRQLHRRLDAVARDGGRIFLQMQFPLHSGRIVGLPGRILISAMGLVVAAAVGDRRGHLVSQAPGALGRISRAAVGTGSRRPEIPAAAE